jgi:hypothetical protein
LINDVVIGGFLKAILMKRALMVKREDKEF